MAVDLTTSMIPERLYTCRQEIRINGRMPDGKEAFSLVPEGTPVIPVLGKGNTQSLLVDGAVVPFNWTTPGWGILFCEASVG